MTNEPSLTYEELKRRLANAEATLQALRSNQMEPIAGGNRTLVVRLAEAQTREEHIKKVLLAIRNVNQLVLSENDSLQMIKRACVNLTDTLGYFNAWIALWDETSGAVNATACSGFDDGFTALGKRIESGLYPSCMKRTLKGDGVVVVKDPKTECTDCPLSREYGGRAGLICGLHYGGRTYGILSVSIPGAYAIDEEEQALFNELAGELAFVLHKIETVKQQRANEAMLSRTERIAQIGSWEWEIAHDRVRWSEGLFRIFQRAPSEGTPSFAEHSALFVDEDMPRLREAVEGCATNGTPYEIELRGIRRDGAIRHCVARGQAETDLQGNIHKLVGSLQDITERKQLEERIALLGGMLDEAPASITIHDAEGCFLFANQQTLRLHGYETEEAFLAINLHDLDVPESEAMIAERIRQITDRGEARFETAHYCKDGSILPLEITCKIINWNGQPTILSIATDIKERKRAEEALRESEERNRLLSDLTMEGILLHQDGVAIDLNLALAKMLGYERDQLLGRNLMEFVHADDRALVLENISKEYASPYAVRAVKRTGDTFFAEIESHNFQKQGDSLRVSAVRDISERKQAEEALRLSEERFRALYENAPMAYQSLDADGRFLDVNPTWLHILGYERDEIIGAWFVDLLHPEFMPKFQENFPQFKQRGEIRGIQFQMRHQKGHYVYVEFNGCVGYQPDGGFRQTYCVFQDITERKRAEEDLRHSEATLRGILDNLQDAYFRADLSGRFTLVNPTAYRMFGYEGEALIGQPAHLLYADPEDRDRILKDLNATGQLRDVVVQGRRKDGATFWVSINVQFLFDGQGAITGTEGVARDLTERRLAEEQHAKLEGQLQQAQRMESVGRLAGGIAHDFNNMLGVIMGHTEAALEQVDPAQPIHAALTEVLKAAGRSADLTRQLLAFARRQTISPKVIDVNATIEGMLKMLRRLIGEDIQLAWLPGMNLWPVKIDPSQIDQILANLSVNARDAIAGIGKVTIETKNVAFDEAYCADHEGFVPGEYILLAVSDDGCGMDKETRSHLFEPFFTTKGVGKGTGLGLATVYGIVNQNNGIINVYSEPGQGTTIKVYLPRDKDHVRQSGQATLEEEPSTNGCETVLVVEDEPALLDLSKIILEELGYLVLSAGTPGDAIRLAKEYSGEIHLLLTDVVMPEMNGRDMAKTLRSLYPHLKCLFMSGYTANVIAHHGVLDEGTHFIQKPFSRKDLAVKVREALGCEEDLDRK